MHLGPVDAPIDVRTCNDVGFAVELAARERGAASSDEGRMPVESRVVEPQNVYS